MSSVSSFASSRVVWIGPCSMAMIPGEQHGNVHLCTLSMSTGNAVRSCILEYTGCDSQRSRQCGRDEVQHPKVCAAMAVNLNSKCLEEVLHDFEHVCGLSTTFSYKGFNVTTLYVNNEKIVWEQSFECEYSVLNVKAGQVQDAGQERVWMTGKCVSTYLLTGQSHHQGQIYPGSSAGNLDCLMWNTAANTIRIWGIAAILAVIV